MLVDENVMLKDFTRTKEAGQIRDFGSERGFSDSPVDGKKRTLSRCEMVLSIDNAGGNKLSVVAISEKPLTEVIVGLKLDKVHRGTFTFCGVTIYWAKVRGNKFPSTTHPILLDTTITNHHEIPAEDRHRYRCVPTSKEHGPLSFLTTIYPERSLTKAGKQKKNSSDHPLSAVAKYTAARFYPGVELQRLKDVECNDSLPLSLATFDGITSFGQLTRVLWAANNTKFVYLQEDVVLATMGIIASAIPELAVLIESINNYCPIFKMQICAVFQSMRVVLRLDPNVPAACL